MPRSALVLVVMHWGHASLTAPKPTAQLHECRGWRANLAPLKKVSHLQVGTAPCHGPWLGEQSPGCISALLVCVGHPRAMNNLQKCGGSGGGEARRLGTSPRGSSLWVHTGGSRVTRENNLTSVVRHFTFITSKSRNETQVHLKFSPTPCGYTVQIFHAEQIFKAKRQNYSLRFLGLKMSCRFI